MSFPYLTAVEISHPEDQYPAALIQTDDFSSDIGILVTGKGAFEFAQELVRRCNDAG